MTSTPSPAQAASTRSMMMLEASIRKSYRVYDSFFNFCFVAFQPGWTKSRSGTRSGDCQCTETETEAEAELTATDKPQVLCTSTQVYSVV